jgi:hypothetical protein
VKDFEVNKTSEKMHIGGFNFLQQNKASSAVDSASDVVSSSAGVLKEFNKNTAATTTSENFKVNKKYKYGHVNKSFEPSSAYGKCANACF